MPRLIYQLSLVEVLYKLIKVFQFIIFHQDFSLECVTEKYFSYFSSKTYVVGTQKNRLNETGFYENPKHMLKLTGKKLFTILRSKILFI